MFLNNKIDDLRTKLKTLASCEWGFMFPQEVDVEDFPYIFIWGGQSEITINSNDTFSERQRLSIYLMMYYEYPAVSQSDAIENLNILEQNVINTILNNCDFVIENNITIDKDRTFINVGIPFNFNPPYYCSRIDITLMEEYRR